MTSEPRPVDAIAETQRLFIAVTLPAGVRDVLASLPQKIAGVTWSRGEQWHLTLRFIGDTAISQIDRLLERLATVHVEPFVLPVEGVGTFPPNRLARVVWVGTGSGHPRLFQLRQRIDDAVLAAGIDMDVRTFHPHITIARCSDNAGPGLTQWVHAHREFTAPPFRVESFELFRSELQPGGAVHSIIKAFPLTRES